MSRRTHEPTTPEEFVDRLRALCLALPETREEIAWTGTRWMIRAKNFAHVVTIADGWPHAYAQAAETDGPATVVTFRCAIADVDSYRHARRPFFVPVWFPNIVGTILDAPKKLTTLLDAAE